LKNKDCWGVTGKLKPWSGFGEGDYFLKRRLIVAVWIGASVPSVASKHQECYSSQ